MDVKDYERLDKHIRTLLPNGDKRSRSPIQIAHAEPIGPGYTSVILVYEVAVIKDDGNYDTSGADPTYVFDVLTYCPEAEFGYDPRLGATVANFVQPKRGFESMHGDPPRVFEYYGDALIFFANQIKLTGEEANDLNKPRADD